MTIAKLEKTEWSAFFDRASKLLLGKHTEIEVTGLAIGSQIGARDVPLLGIAYDPRDDIIEIMLEGLDHIVRNPCAVYVDNDRGMFTRLQIIDGDGVIQIIVLHDPLMLPAPRH
jgi:hypothetical protein